MSGPVANSDTPLSKGRANGHHTHSLGTPEEARGTLKQYRAEIADDMAHAAVLAEKEEFCDKYFPIPSNPHPNKPKPDREVNPFAELAKLKKFKGNEAQIRAKFAKAVNAHNLIPGLVFRECGERPDGLHIDPSQQKVDAAWYFERDAKDDGKPDWGNQVLPVEFKGDETGDDPFDDGKENISTATVSRKKARAQMITYSELLHAIQQRAALFMLVIIGKRARFTRWDRSGTVVTRAFNYIKNWQFFCDVLWRIGNCSTTQLGFDPTATRLSETDPDWQRMRVAAHEKECVDHSERVLEDGQLPEGEFKYVQDMFKHSLVRGWPRYRVEVPVEGPDGAKTFRYFLIAKPTFRAKGMAGRGTRGYVALDCATEKFVWLKDAWRANYEFVDKEGNILAALNQAQVPNVPTMLCHGDIDGQTTETPDWWERLKEAREEEARERQERDRSTPVSSATGSSRTCVDSSSSKGKKRQRDDDAEASEESGTKTESCPLRLHQHYRLVVKEVAMPLDRFEFPKQLVQVMFDCVLAHWKAATLPKSPLLHRDISSGNILIYPVVRASGDGEVALKWRGLLADWEMSKPIHKDHSEQRKARQPERTGTWQYLSIALLTPGPMHVGLPDELESFLHVLVYYALRYVKSANCNGESIANFLHQYFDLYGREDGMYICGDLKRATIERGDICVGSKTYIRFNNPLDKLFPELLSWFRARYVILTHENKKVSTAKGDNAGSSAAVPQPEKLDADVSSFLAQYSSDRKPREQTEGPSEEVKALARRLELHTDMMVEFGTALAGAWPHQEAEDQIPSGWKPPPGDTFAQSLSRNVENKRKRIHEAKEYFSDPPPFRGLVAPRPPHTPQRRAAVSLGFFPEDEDESP